MKIKFFASAVVFMLALSSMAAYQYETNGNRGWFTFDSETTLSSEVTRSGKDKDHENFIDRGEGIADYGWYNLDTDESGSFANGASATFKEGDRIGLYVKDSTGQVFASNKPYNGESLGDDVDWGKTGITDDGIAIYGGNKGSNGTHEYYLFKVSTVTGNGNTTSGQPLPGIIATLVVGGGALVYMKKRKALYKEN